MYRVRVTSTLSAEEKSHTILTTEADISGSSIRVSLIELKRKVSHFSSTITSLVPVESEYNCDIPNNYIIIISVGLILRTNEMFEFIQILTLF